MPLMSGRRDKNDHHAQRRIMNGRGAINGHRHLVIEQNVTNGNEPNVDASGGSGNRIRLRVTAGNVRMRSTPLVRTAYQSQPATAEVWFAGGQGCLDVSV